MADYLLATKAAQLFPKSRRLLDSRQVRMSETSTAPKSGRRIGAWVVAVTACDAKAPGLGNGQ